MSDILNAIFGGLQAAAAERQQREWTEKDWQAAMRRTSMMLADNIVRAALNERAEGDDTWPNLVSLISPDDGVSSFITMESANAAFTIVVSTARKAEPMTPVPSTDYDSYGQKCVLCGKVHEGATTRAMADEKYRETGEAVQNTPDEPVKPWPSWGEKSDSHDATAQ